MSKEFEEWALSTDGLIVASYLTLLEAIEINNMAVERQLAEAGVPI